MRVFIGDRVIIVDISVKSVIIMCIAIIIISTTYTSIYTITINIIAILPILIILPSTDIIYITIKLTNTITIHSLICSIIQLLSTILNKRVFRLFSSAQKNQLRI